MHYELEITLNNEFFTINANYNIINYINKFNDTGECWFDFKLSNSEINHLKSLALTSEEKEFVSKLKENELIDVLIHFRF